MSQLQPQTSPEYQRGYQEGFSYGWTLAAPPSFAAPPENDYGAGYMAGAAAGYAEKKYKAVVGGTILQVGLAGAAAVACGIIAWFTRPTDKG